MKIKIEKPDPEWLRKHGVSAWPVWEKEASKFDWYYDTTEVCYILKGKAIVTTPDGERVEIGKGDLVTFPAGLSCTWEIVEDISKHYTFM